MSTDSKFHTWSIEGQRVECAASVLDQITSAARDGFRRFRHGGMEIGGILIGSQERSRVRVVDAQAHGHHVWKRSSIPPYRWRP